MKQYFTGKTGCLFWLNVLLAFSLIAAIPVILYFTLDGWTHHGEKIEVPIVVGNNGEDALALLEKAGLEGEISDSVYKKTVKPGAVMEQNPKPGAIVKSGHLIHLTVNYMCPPMVKLPDLAGNSSRRQAEVILRDMGFKLTEPTLIYGRPKDLVITVKQGGKEILAGTSINKEKAITLVCGAGEEEEIIKDSVDFDELYDEGFMTDTVAVERNHFEEVL